MLFYGYGFKWKKYLKNGKSKTIINRVKRPAGRNVCWAFSD